MKKKTERKTLGNDQNRVGRRDIILPLSTVSTTAVHSINTIGGYTHTFIISCFILFPIRITIQRAIKQIKLNPDWLVAFE